MRCAAPRPTFCPSSLVLVGAFGAIKPLDQRQEVAPRLLLGRRLAQQEGVLGADELALALRALPRDSRPSADSERARPSVIPGRDSKPYTEEELSQLRDALERSGGNVAKVATELGISRPRIYRMLKHLEGG